jgi:hypothetical protein
MTRLVFNTPASIAAARHLLGSPPLAYSPFVEKGEGLRLNSQPHLFVDIRSGAPFSSGEAECLLPLLSSLSTEGSFFDLRSLWKLDEVTRMTACQAVMLGAGVIREVVRT